MSKSIIDTTGEIRIYEEIYKDKYGPCLKIYVNLQLQPNFSF